MKPKPNITPLSRAEVALGCAKDTWEIFVKPRLERGSDADFDLGLFLAHLLSTVEDLTAEVRAMRTAEEARLFQGEGIK